MPCMYVCMYVCTIRSPAHERRYGICMPTVQTVTLPIIMLRMVEVAQGIQDDL